LESSTAPATDADEELLELKDEFTRRLGAADKTISELKVRA
jgi:hypothetical protein